MTDRIPFPEHAWPLLRKALEHIAENPARLYMPSWVKRRTDHTPEYWAAIERDITSVTGLPVPECGTVACLAGWVTILGSGAKYPSDFTALEDLGLSTCRSVDDDESFVDEVSDALSQVFDLTGIRTYAALAAALEARFTFPEPLPAIPAAVSP